MTLRDRIGFDSGGTKLEDSLETAVVHGFHSLDFSAESGPNRLDSWSQDRADAVREICARTKAEYDKPMKIIGTGGLAPLFAQADVLFDVIEDDLTMHGLTVIHQYNKEHA